MSLFVCSEFSPNGDFFYEDVSLNSIALCPRVRPYWSKNRELLRRVKVKEDFLISSRKFSRFAICPFFSLLYISLIIYMKKGRSKWASKERKKRENKLGEINEERAKSEERKMQKQKRVNHDKTGTKSKEKSEAFSLVTFLNEKKIVWVYHEWDNKSETFS